MFIILQIGPYCWTSPEAMGHDVLHGLESIPDMCVNDLRVWVKTLANRGEVGGRCLEANRVFSALTGHNHTLAISGI